jgi:hypothetical protein
MCWGAQLLLQLLALLLKGLPLRFQLLHSLLHLMQLVSQIFGAAA